MSALTHFIANQMLVSEHKYVCIKAAQYCHDAVGPEATRRAHNELLGKCLLFHTPVAADFDAVDLAQLADLLDPVYK